MMKRAAPAATSLGTESLQRWLDAVDPSVGFTTLAGLIDQAAVFVVDRDRAVQYWNTGAEKLLRFRAGEVLGQHCLKSNRCPQCMRGCGIAEHGRVTGALLTLYRADGSSLAVRKHAQAFFDADGTFAGGIEVLVPEVVEDTRTPPDPRLTGAQRVEFHGLLTRSPAMRQVFPIIANAAETESTVLVRGESGTGKELVARAIHNLSHRKDGPFLAINCAALTPSLLESELFGHVRGAFTGALRDHPGLFQRADRGTVFLDEVAELPVDLQAKLLRVLQERNFVPVGGDRSVTVDVRIVAATHRALREEVKAGRFREDLMYRLRVVPIFLPALRERREDVGLLLWEFIERHNARGVRRIERIAPEAMRVLLDHSWPGNVRELKNVVEYAFAVGRGTELRLSELPPEFREPRTPPSVAVKRNQRLSPEHQAERVRLALQETGGDIHRAAQLAGMSRATFWRKRKQFGI
jgi:transcriptional regulator with PAS, ATPase and Fis domain